MAAHTPDINELSGDWKKDVGTYKHERQDVRDKFVTKAALLSLRVENESEIDAALSAPHANELASLPDMSGQKLAIEHIPAGTTLSGVLRTYFREKLGITDADKLRRNVNATLYFLTKKGKDLTDSDGRSVNVDYLRAGWRLTIDDGYLTVEDPSDTARFSILEVPMRPEAAAGPRPGPRTPPAPAPGPRATPPPAPAPGPVPSPAPAPRATPPPAPGPHEVEPSDKGRFRKHYPAFRYRPTV